MVVLQVGEVPVHAVEGCSRCPEAVVEHAPRANPISMAVVGERRLTSKVSVRVVGQRVADHSDHWVENRCLGRTAVRRLVGIPGRRVCVRQGFEAAERVFRRATKRTRRPSGGHVLRLMAAALKLCSTQWRGLRRRGTLSFQRVPLVRESPGCATGSRRDAQNRIVTVASRKCGLDGWQPIGGSPQSASAHGASLSC